MYKKVDLKQFQNMKPHVSLEHMQGPGAKHRLSDNAIDVDSLIVQYG